MGRKRFQSLSRFIRFDDYSTRQERAANDKTASISDIWKMLNENFAAMYRPTAHLTIDEQLFPYRGRTKFTQYMPSKPAKYGLKIFWLCDAKNAYPLKGIFYTGKQGNTREVDQGERVVTELVADYKGSNRNITMDIFFTALPLAVSLLKPIEMFDSEVETNDTTSEGEDQQEIPVIRQSTRLNKGVPPKRLITQVNKVTKEINTDPSTYEEAINGPNSEDWKVAMRE